MPQWAWVWQRVWTPAVGAAVERSDFDGLLVLAAEVSWSGSAADVHVVELDDPLPVGSAVVVRVEVPPEDVDPTDVLVPLVVSLFEAHPEAVGLQLDMDLPTRRLREYPAWLSVVRERLAGRWLEVTTLPTWIEARALIDVAEAVDRTVLQVHWLDPAAPDHLLSPLAVEHVEAMAGLGQPFRVGLPTCGYAVALDSAGSLVAVAAEQGTPAIPPGGRVASLLPDPGAVASLVAGWTKDRPELLRGLVWFRLPTAQDQRAWPSQTLAAVRQGRVPVARAEPIARSPASVRPRDKRLWDIVLRNTGDASLPLPALEVDGRVRMAEGVGVYAWSADRGQFLPSPKAAPLPPSSELVIGWLRTASDSAEPPHVLSVSPSVDRP